MGRLPKLSEKQRAVITEALKDGHSVPALARKYKVSEKTIRVHLPPERRKPRKELEDLTGRTFGKWTVLRVALRSEHTGDPHRHWVCQCTCGRVRPLRHANLVIGATLQCRQCSTRQNLGRRWLPKPKRPAAKGKEER